MTSEDMTDVQTKDTNPAFSQAEDGEEVFDLNYCHKFSLKNRKGEIEKYELRPMSGAQRDAYLKFLKSRKPKKIGEGDNVEFEDASDVLGKALDGLIFKRSEAGIADEKPMDYSWVNSLPSPLQKKLYDWVIGNSGLSEKSLDKAKNE